jgi:hypothetical protein
MSNGFDGLLLLRLIDKEEETVVSLGESAYVYPTLWEVSGVPLTVSTASFAATLRTYTADLAVFSVDTGRAIWVGRMKAEDPKHLRELLDDLVKAGHSELKKQKLVQ